MTEQEILERYEELEKFYGGALPNPENQPKQFEYLIKLFEYHNKNRKVNDE